MRFKKKQKPIYIRRDFERLNISTSVPAGYTEVIRKHANRQNESSDGFISRAVNEALQKATGEYIHEFVERAIKEAIERDKEKNSLTEEGESYKMSMMGSTMKFPVIRVKDKLNQDGHVHIVGTDSHDSLFIDQQTGGLHYLNLQCRDGTGCSGGYEFEGKFNEYNHHVEIEFVTMEELLQIYKEQVHISGEQEKYLREICTEVMKKYSAELHKSNNDEVWHN